MNPRALGIVVGCALAFAGCRLGPDYERPTMALPETWPSMTRDAAEVATDLAWFDQFDEPGLAAAVRASIDGNLDLLAALRRVEQFRARAGFADAVRYPQVEYAFLTQPGGAHGDIDNTYQAGLGLSWELDLFGKLGRASEAARVELLASEDTARAVMSALAASVAQTWIDLRRLDRQRAVVLENIRIQEEALRLVRSLLASGVTSALEELQAINQLATTRAQLPQLELAIAQGEHLLSLLMGRPPTPVERPAAERPQPLPPAITPGLPSALLERRPDVRASEHVLHAATARIGIAAADRIPVPTISLTSFLGTASDELSGVFTGSSGDNAVGLFSLGANIAGPLLDFGRTRSVQDEAEAAAEQAALAWRQTVLTALREVADALVAREKTRATIEQQDVRVSSGLESVRLATKRFQAGVTSYLEVLDAQRVLLAAQLDLESSRRDEVAASIELYRALGGGWSDEELKRLAERPADARE